MITLTRGGLISDLTVVVTTNDEKSAEVIVGRNTEGLNNIHTK
ncbi:MULTISPECIES: hypothetical protein [unclassified Staphylococcus]|nr:MULTISPECIES: hypothetical protein [unclassified Staphylococcus]